MAAARDQSAELAAAIQRAERAEARATDLAASIRRGERLEQAAPVELPPLERRVRARSLSPHREWSGTERYAVVGAIVLIALTLLILLVALL